MRSIERSIADRDCEKLCDLQQAADVASNSVTLNQVALTGAKYGIVSTLTGGILPNGRRAGLSMQHPSRFFSGMPGSGSHVCRCPCASAPMD